MIPEICPGWFQGFNLAFQLIFLIITASISYKAMEAYRFFARDQYKYLSLGFAIFALSYIADLVSTTTHLFGGLREVAVGALYAHAYLFLGAVMVLLFAYLDIDQAAVRAVLLILVFGFMIVIGENSMIFHLVTGLLMFFIVGQLMLRYRRTCKRSTLVVTFGFTFLTIGQLLMAVASMHQLVFVIAALSTLFGFMSIAASKLVR